MSSASAEFRVLNREDGNTRVGLYLDEVLWNVITGPTAYAIIQELDSKTRFDEREMKILKAIFAGEVSAARLFEGGDYTYSISNDQGMTRDERDAFLEKIG